MAFWIPGRASPDATRAITAATPNDTEHGQRGQILLRPRGGGSRNVAVNSIQKKTS